MKFSEKGFTMVELVVATAIIAIIGVAATTSVFHVVRGTGRTNDNMNAICQVQNAGYWISCDAQVADSVIVGSVGWPLYIYLMMFWTEQDYDGGNPTYHSVSYFFEDLYGGDGVGTLKRYHWSSAGDSDYTLIASNIYYDDDDPGNTTKASYQNPALSLQITAVCGDITESRQYKINRRPNLD